MTLRAIEKWPTKIRVTGGGGAKTIATVIRGELGEVKANPGVPYLVEEFDNENTANTVKGLLTAEFGRVPEEKGWEFALSKAGIDDIVVEGKKFLYVRFNGDWVNKKIANEKLARMDAANAARAAAREAAKVAGSNGVATEVPVAG